MTITTQTKQSELLWAMIQEAHADRAKTVTAQEYTTVTAVINRLVDERMNALIAECRQGV